MEVGHSTHVICITPFDRDLRLDEGALRGHLGRMADAGIGVYLGGSGSGEGYVLSEREVDRVLEIGVDELHGRVSVRAMGVEPRTAAEVVRLGARAAAIGVDGLQVYSLDMGHGRRPRHDEMRRYFFEVLSELTVPSYISTHQYSGQLIPVPLAAELIDSFPLLSGVNCTTSDLRYLVDLLEVTRGRVELHVGGAEHVLNAMALGANGFLLSESNLAPRLCQSVVQRWGDGDVAGATRSFATVLRLFVEVQRRGGISGTKGVLTALGLPGGPPRPPRLEIPDAWVAELLEIIDSLGIAQWEDWGR